VSVTTHELGFEALDALSGVEALCVFVGEDERPLRGTAGYVDWRLCGKLSRVLLDGFFVGTKNDTLLLPSEGRLPAPRVFAVGLGTQKGLDRDTLQEALGTAARMLAKAQITSVAMEIPGHGSVDDAARVEALMSTFMPKFSGGRVAVLADKPFGKLLQATRPASK
jgi:leucyl aminopeptidase